MSYYSSTGYGPTITVTVVGMGVAAQPVCHRCKSPGPIYHDQKNQHWCRACKEDYQREQARKSAATWIEAAFLAVTDRAALYKALARVFHPDAGGDEELMKALNAVRERLP